MLSPKEVVKKWVLVFSQAPVHDFSVTKQALDDPKNVFHLAAHGGLPVFDKSFPINGVVGYPGQALRAAVDAVVDA